MSKREENEKEIAILGAIAGTYKALGLSVYGLCKNSKKFTEKEFINMIEYFYQLTEEQLSKLHAKAGERKYG